jgi:hypothetical protein
MTCHSLPANEYVARHRDLYMHPIFLSRSGALPGSIDNFCPTFQSYSVPNICARPSPNPINVPFSDAFIVRITGFVASVVNHYRIIIP